MLFVQSNNIESLRPVCIERESKFLEAKVRVIVASGVDGGEVRMDEEIRWGGAA